jgi:hypothetical protein
MLWARLITRLLAMMPKWIKTLPKSRMALKRKPKPSQ